jgi:hypothetical protein
MSRRDQTKIKNDTEENSVVPSLYMVASISVYFGTMNHHQLAASAVLLFITACLLSPYCATAFILSSPFTSSSPHVNSRTTTTVLGLTSDEILANARRAAGLPPEEKQPMLYDDDLLNDFQQALLTLEKRVKQGPGSLSILEVEEFSGQVQRILKEARENPDKRLPRPAAKTTTMGDAVTATATATTTAPPAPRPQLTTTAAPAAVQRQQPAAASVVASSSGSIMDKSLDEGPVYDGRGGLGQPRGTVNTYVIPGMDEMSVEEYRAALQESVLERQRQRKNSGVVTGNRATWDYLNQLNGNKGDDLGVLSKGGKKYNNKNNNNYGPSGGGGGGGSGGSN